MKKLILTLIVTLSSLGLFSQSTLMSRAYHSFYGEIVDTRIEWIRDQPYIDILVDFGTDAITVFSEERQVYRIIRETGSWEGTVVWKAMDNYNRFCFLYVTDLDPKTVSLTIRYDEYAWAYICRK
jgi:hypothetical protein